MMVAQGAIGLLSYDLCPCRQHYLPPLPWFRRSLKSLPMLSCGREGGSGAGDADGAGVGEGATIGVEGGGATGEGTGVVGGAEAAVMG